MKSSEFQKLLSMFPDMEIFVDGRPVDSVKGEFTVSNALGHVSGRINITTGHLPGNKERSGDAAPQGKPYPRLKRITERGNNQEMIDAVKSGICRSEFKKKFGETDWAYYRMRQEYLHENKQRITRGISPEQAEAARKLLLKSDRTRGDVEDVARSLGVTRITMYRWMHKVLGDINAGKIQLLSHEDIHDKIAAEIAAGANINDVSKKYVVKVSFGRS